MQRISSEDLLAFDDFVGEYPISIDLVYAQAGHPNNLFKEAIYKADAKVWGHKDMVALTLKAAEICFDNYGWVLEVKDCLRPVEAQQFMLDSNVIKENPSWMEEPRLLSPPKKGGHPRGMAIDVIPLKENGEQIEMGTAFDALPEDKKNNLSARNYKVFSNDDSYNNMILENRDKLTNSMLKAAEIQNMDLLPLPQEWWDFRFMPDYTNMFAPIYDVDLPESMRVMIE